ncbi:MAG: selenobiotic family peptide radical SAM maturase [Nitrospirae bacterium]|nr:selenobiotic family peptide radical SAM maturase [Nitrospirota bacterium]
MIQELLETINEAIKQSGSEAASDLLRLEDAVRKAWESGQPSLPDKIIINPSLNLLPFLHKNLPPSLIREYNKSCNTPHAMEFVLVWKNYGSQTVAIRPASEEDLLVLKIISDDLSPEAIAKEAIMPVGALDKALMRAVNSSLLISPGSKIKRDREILGDGAVTDESFVTAQTFTLQWHLTQACDLHCKHCYDRSDRSQMSIEQALAVLKDFRAFCNNRFVSGSISFTGGNPLLFPHVKELYRAAADYGFSLSMLGNPASRETLESLLEIQELSHFQVSLEGLPEHNDSIRGRGHFDRTITFLALLRKMGIYSMVMLTLTKDNMAQVIPLAEMLRNLTDSFFFNRLSAVGEGAQLTMPDTDSFEEFLAAYMEAMKSNPVMGLKDNLFNILLYKKEMPLFGGCAGFGCSAAFNFVSVLADGEVHACRKFPSPIGNIFHQSLAEIYDSDAAGRYRSGCSECRSCSIRPVCGGCLASAYSKGLDVFNQKDPYCFFKDKEKRLLCYE